MNIILNDIEYTAPAPVTKLWFEVQKLKSEQEKRVTEMAKMWEEIKPLEGKNDLDDQAIKKLEKSLIDLNKKTAENKRILLESKIKVIVDVFKNPAITQETILEHMPLQNISIEYAKIENWLNDIVIGRTSQLPNV